MFGMLLNGASRQPYNINSSNRLSITEIKPGKCSTVPSNKPLLGENAGSAKAWKLLIPKCDVRFLHHLQTAAVRPFFTLHSAIRLMHKAQVKSRACLTTATEAHGSHSKHGHKMWEDEARPA
jgi:hypothetical protein